MDVHLTTHATSVHHVNLNRPATTQLMSVALTDVQLIVLAAHLAKLANRLLHHQLLLTVIAILVRADIQPLQADAPMDIQRQVKHVLVGQKAAPAINVILLLLTVTAILVRADIQPLQADAPMDIQRQVKHVLVGQKAAPAINVNLHRLTVTAILVRADIQPLQADAPMDIQQQVKHVLVGQKAAPAINVNLHRLAQ